MLRTSRPFRTLAAILYLGAFSLAGGRTVSASVLPAVGLVSWWPADGNALDIAGGNSGTAHDGLTYAPGMVGQAFSFNGQRAAIGVPDAESLKITGSLSISAWILPDLVCEFRTSQAGFHLDDSEAVLEAGITDGGVVVGANPIVPVTSQ